MQPFIKWVVFKTKSIKNPIKMNNQKTTIFLLFLLMGTMGFAQIDDDQYITFND